MRILTIQKFQSTLPRRERRNTRYRSLPRLPISIHAPAKGATGVWCDFEYDTEISIHAPAKGATSQVFSMIFLTLYFNPRSREGSDASQTAEEAVNDVISIHAPAKGATISVPKSSYVHAISIHAPAKGATDKEVESMKIYRISIHAPAKGATVPEKHSCFYADISIHAPAKGATAFINIFSLAVRLFFISSHQ